MSPQGKSLIIHTDAQEMSNSCYGKGKSPSHTDIEAWEEQRMCRH